MEGSSTSRVVSGTGPYLKSIKAKPATALKGGPGACFGPNEQPGFGGDFGQDRLGPNGNSRGHAAPLDQGEARLHWAYLINQFKKSRVSKSRPGLLWSLV